MLQKHGHLETLSNHTKESLRKNLTGQCTLMEYLPFPCPAIKYFLQEIKKLAVTKNQLSVPGQLLNNH